MKVKATQDPFTVKNIILIKHLIQPISLEDLAKKYVEKRNVALGEKRDLFPKEEIVSQHKDSLSL